MAVKDSALPKSARAFAPAAVLLAVAGAASLGPSIANFLGQLYPLLTGVALGAAAVALLQSLASLTSNPTATSSIAAVDADQKQASCNYPSPEQLAALIKGRRSIFPKDLTGAPVPDEALHQMLSAATWAPSHKLTEPWHFVVLGGQAKEAFEDLTLQLCRERLPADKAEATVAKLTKKKEKLWPKVHCYIAICLKRHAEAVPEWEEVAAVAAAVQNLSLTATALGVAGYWSSWQEAAHEAPEMVQFLGLQLGDKCLGVFVTGSTEEGFKSRQVSRAAWQEKVDWRL